MTRWLLAHSAAAMMPSVARLPGAKDGGHLDEVVSAVLRESSWLMWLGLVGAAVGFMLSPVTTVGWPLPSWLLPKSVLDRHAAAFSAHPLYPLRQSATLIKLAASFAMARDPRVREALALGPDLPDPVDWRR